MPAAAVIPAPIAYIKVVAVKKLVVGFLLIIYIKYFDEYLYNINIIHITIYFSI